MLDRLRKVLLHALAAVVALRQLQHGVGVAVVGLQAQARQVERVAAAREAAHALQVLARHRVALQGGGFVQCAGAGQVALQLHRHAQVVGGHGVAVARGLLQQLQRFDALFRARDAPFDQ